MRVNHGGTHIGMPQQFLHCANVVTGLQQVGGKAMSKGMATRRLQDPRLPDSGLDRTLNDLLVLMLASEGFVGGQRSPASLNLVVRRQHMRMCQVQETTILATSHQI
jgi:hypothetical protein